MADSNYSQRGNHFKAPAQNANTRQASGVAPAYQPARGAYSAGSAYGARSQQRGARPQQPTRTVQRADFDHSRYASDNYSPRRGGAGKKVALALLIVLLVFGAAGGALGFTVYRDAMGILDESKTMIEEAKGMKEQLKSFDLNALSAKANELANRTASMKTTTDQVNWKIASFIPVLGDDIRAARGLVKQADNLMQNAVVPACSSLAALNPETLLSDGAINVQTLQSVINTLQSVEPVIRECATQIDNLPATHIGKVTNAIAKVREPLDSVVDTLDTVNQLAPMLPQMLGANGQTRTYLLVAQNNAELRSTGGLPGSMGTLTITDGKIEMGDFTATASLSFYDSPQFGATDEEISIFGDRIGRKANDSNFIPDWSRASYFIKEIYKDQVSHTDVDGVVGIDPVFLQALLALTGGVDVNGTTVDGTNAARLLMHDAYQNMGTDETDAFFASTASLAFHHVMDNLGSAGISGLVSTLKTGVEQGHFMVCMTNESEQQLMEQVGCAFTMNTDATKPQVGVFPTDDTWSKISWYFSDNTQVSEGVANADGTTTYHVTTTMTNHLTSDEASGLVSYITGYNGNKRSLADMVMPVYLTAPAGGYISNVETSGGDFSLGAFSETSYNGTQMYVATMRLNAGEVAVVTFDVTVSAEATEPLTVRTSPTAQAAAGWEAEAQGATEAAEGDAAAA